MPTMRVHLVDTLSQDIHTFDMQLLTETIVLIKGIEDRQVVGRGAEGAKMD